MSVKRAAASGAAASARRNKQLVNTLHLQGLVSTPVLDEIADALEVSAASSESNTARKWQRSMNRDVCLPGLYYADVPFASGVKRHPFRLPSVKARELWHNDKQHFDLSKSQQHKGRVETSGNWLKHPLFAQAGLDAVPMTVYGDGVPYVANKYGKKGSLICIYYTFPHRLPLDGTQPTDEGKDADRSWLDDVHLLTVLRKEDLSKDTFDAIWSVLAWDMASMSQGIFASTRHDDTDFLDSDAYLKAVKTQRVAGTAKFAVIQFRQDWEFLCSVYGFKTWGAKEFCPCCNARNEPSSWFEQGIKAGLNIRASGGHVQSCRTTYELSQPL